MPFALVTIGLLFVITGFQDTYKQLGTQLQNDFTGNGNFIYWLISIVIVGCLGYSKPLQTPSRVFMALIILVIVLSKQGLFTQLSNALSSGSSSPVNPVGAPLVGDGNGSGSTSGSGSSIVGDISTAATIASFF